MAAERPAGDGAIDLTGAVGVAARGRAGRLSELSGSTIGFRTSSSSAGGDLVVRQARDRMNVTVPVVPALAAALTADRTAPARRVAEDAPGWRGGTWEEREHGGFGDGLPLVPPTAEAVDAMLGALSDRRDESIGLIPPRLGAATYEVVAANAVMAGCLPQYLPVVVAALRAMLVPEFNLLPLQTTTHPAAPLIVVNGPIRGEIGMNAATGCLGSGNRANATIGRAVRLVLQNVGGARPGEGDRATHGHPGKYSYCFAENEESSPWEALSTSSVTRKASAP